MTPNHEEIQNALDWLLKRQITTSNGQIQTTVMKYVGGDPEERIPLKPSTIAFFMAQFLKEQGKKA